MEPVQKSFSFAFQDLPAIGDFVRASVVRDLEDLRKKSIKYKGDTFLTGYDTALAAVRELVLPATFTAQHKKLTEQMAADAKAIRPLLNNLDIRLDDAVDVAADNPTGPQLHVAPADFGLRPLRQAINAQDAEAIAACGQALLANIARSQQILDAVEYPATEVAELKRLLSSLTTANADQSKLIAARDLVVEQNMTVLNDFYRKYLGRALSDGKKTFKEVSKAKTNDYTLRKLLAQVTATRPKKAKPPKSA